MVTQLPKNEFISNSAPVATPAADTAVALSRTSVLDAQTDAAAEPISNSGRVEGACSGIKRGVNPTQGGESSIRDRTSGLPDATAGETATNHIGEIFHHARKLLAEDNRRAEDFVDWHALEQALEEPLPLFIRDGEHLRRWA